MAGDGEADGDWVLSKSLQVGDLLKSRTGEWNPILSIEKVTETQTTYNFEVEKNHDYFVGENGWLVHNQSFGNARFAAPAEGPAIATSRIELEASFKNAGLNFTRSTQTAENGLIFADARNGNLFRVMEGISFHPRLITSASGGNPIAPWGGNIPSIIRGKSAVRSLTHFPLGP
ncbi:hypothetical protein BH10ACI1_BH10ACI1_29730 [soil metagenome]